MTRQHRPKPAGQPLTDEATLRDALARLVSSAFRKEHENGVPFSIPANPKRDSDYLLGAAIDELVGLRTRLRAAEERAEFERQNAERIQRARQRTEEECEVRVRTAEDRAGRLRALLTEAMEQTVGVYGLDEIRARIDAELIATVAPQPSEGE